MTIRATQEGPPQAGRNKWTKGNEKAIGISFFSQNFHAAQAGARAGSPLLANETRRQKILCEFSAAGGLAQHICNNKFCKTLQHYDLHFAQKIFSHQGISLILF
ncbi:hypothetical protein SMSP1_01501 [Sedimentisphaera salicampi]|nr:hypothetical protein SMSP1_01501 [Sedimentisphaera salicampi]